MKPARPARYAIRADRSELHVRFDDHFFDNTILDAQGTTVLDRNIAAVIQEIRAALYYVGTDTTPH